MGPMLALLTELCLSEKSTRQANYITIYLKFHVNDTLIQDIMEHKLQTVNYNSTKLNWRSVIKCQQSNWLYKSKAN